MAVRTVSLSLPGQVWSPSNDASTFRAAQMQAKQSSISVPSPRWIEWLFDADANEYILTTLLMPDNFVSNASFATYYKMASATSGNIVWSVQVHALTNTDAVDLDADSLANVQSNTDAVPGTAGHVAVTNPLGLPLDDSLAAGDFVTLALYRQADSVADTATGDAEFIGAEFLYRT